MQQRSDYENKNNYDYFISFHRNAFKPEAATGVETYTYLNQDSRSKAMSDKIQAAIVNIGFINRGVKKANFHVLRETKAPAILIELGFIDNSKDNSVFDSKKSEIIKAISKAILDQLGVTYKEESVSSNPDYEFVGVFADKGITGTTDKRPEFQRMLRFCREEKVDLIITKSISRFARNTTIVLSTVRELRGIGVEVRFEKEDINTLSGDGEFMLTVLSSFAQEEWC